jgi:hypothetical protein
VTGPTLTTWMFLSVFGGMSMMFVVSTFVVLMRGPRML